MSDRYAQVHGLFDHARGLKPDERSEWLVRQCKGDASLVQEVQELLESLETRDSDAFSEEGIEASRASLESLAHEIPATGGPERAGDHIDRYRLVQQIGEGGMGEVWRAEQVEPVRREVALKICKPGLNPKALGARFERERQALAAMNHPHIAKVLDGGTTPSDRPYLVMDLVEGMPIAAFVRSESLSLAERLTLFAQVCHAVQHAHARGILHRDLKSSNVLVSRDDGTPSPHVIDFGISKLLEPEESSPMGGTRTFLPIGSPDAMAPEQAEGRNDLVDIRTDVYALGALLYLLLTGSKPIDTETALKSGYGEFLRILREQEPEPPSKRVRGANFPDSSWANQLRGDLDWITLRALAKNSVDRYATVADLAQDVERFLDDRPVEAAPPRALYRLKKLARRHRVAASAIGLATFSLIGGTVGTSVGLLNSMRTNSRLDMALEEKQEALDLAQELTHNLRKAEATLIGGAMVSSAAALEAGAVWEAARDHGRVPEPRRGWSWNLLSRRLPRLLDLPSDLPDLAPLRDPIRPRWRFAGDDHVFALDRDRDAVRVVPFEDPLQEVERFAGLGLEWLDVATPTGWAMGWADGETLLLNVLDGSQAGRWPSEKSFELGHASDDARVVALLPVPGVATVYVEGQLVATLDISRDAKPQLRPHARVSPSGDRVFFNSLKELSILETATGERRTHTPGPGFNILLGAPLEQGWISHQFLLEDRSRMASWVQEDGAVDLEAGLLPVRQGPVPVFRTPLDGRFVTLGCRGGFQLLDVATSSAIRLSPFQGVGGYFACDADYWAIAEVSPSGKRLLGLPHGDKAPWSIELDGSTLEPGFDPRCSTYRGHVDVLYHLAVSADGHFVASASPGENAIRLWDALTLETLAVIPRRREDFGSKDCLMAFSDGASRLVATTPLPDTSGVAILEFDLFRGETKVHWPDPPLQGGNHAPLLDPFLDVLGSGVRGRLSQKAALAGDSAISLFRAYEGAGAWRDDDHQAGERWRRVALWDRKADLDALGFSIDMERNRTALVAMDQIDVGAPEKAGVLTIQNLVGDGTPTQIALDRGPMSVDFSPDGSLVAIGMFDGWVQILETDHLTLQHEFRAHGGYIYSIAWMPDGRRLVTASEDHTVRIWDDRGSREQAAQRLAWSRLLTELASQDDLEQELLSSSPERRSAARAVTLRRRYEREK